MINSQKAFWASVWMYNLSLTVTKISILVQYLRLFPTRRFRIVCYVVLGIVTAYGVWTLFGNIFICTPVEFFWNKSLPNGSCLNQFTVWFTNAGVNIVQDFVILVLPMPVLRSLSIPKGQKRALMVVFALGGFVCLISIVRLQSLVRISNSLDPTFDNPPAATFSAVEANVGIICACLPYMRPLLSTMFPTYFPETASRYVRPDDEERTSHIRQPSASIQPFTPTVANIQSHSRTSSKSSVSLYTNESEMGNIYRPHSTRTATFVKGHARQVTIGSSVGSERMLPFTRNSVIAPRKPDSTFTFGSLEQAGRQGSLSSPRTPRRHQPPPTPVVQKPLPITPFPVARPENR